MTINEMIQGLTKAKELLGGDVLVQADVSVSTVENFPTLHIIYGEVPEGKYCVINTGFRLGDDPEFYSDDESEYAEADCSKISNLLLEASKKLV
jgi:hypothetical protein